MFNKTPSLLSVDFTQNGIVEMAGTERALLGFFLAKMHKIDPDVLVVSLNACSKFVFYIANVFYYCFFLVFLI